MLQMTAFRCVTCISVPAVSPRRQLLGLKSAHMHNFFLGEKWLRKKSCRESLRRASSSQVMLQDHKNEYLIHRVLGCLRFWITLYLSNIRLPGVTAAIQTLPSIDHGQCQSTSCCNHPAWPIMGDALSDALTRLDHRTGERRHICQ